MSLRVALLQTRTPAEQKRAFDHVAPLVRAAAADGARFILTPEGTNLLQRDREKLADLMRSEDEDPCVADLRDLARSLKVTLLIGSALVKKPEGGAANRSLLVGTEGEIIARYDKIHMFDVDLPTGESPRESRVYTPGEDAVLVRSSLGALGLTICYDMRFPELYRSLAQAGAQVFTIPSAFTRPTGAAHWSTLLRARAIENGAFVLAPAQGGLHEDGRATWGRTLAVSPWGEVMGELDHDEPGVLMLELDLELVDKARAAIPSLKNGRPFRLREVGP
ncbi:MAG: carbon-nitrogen hydrolase family protein [Pseudomonadota bacterium]|jgi:predicted amidohydrolase